MKNLLASACAVAALSLAAPVSAQGILGDVISGVFGGSNRIGNYEERIRVAYQRGEISESEARELQRRYDDLRQREQQYRQDGLSREERADLQRRSSDLQRRFQMARNDGGYNDGGYNDDDRWGDNNGRRCPPGLAKKRNGCLPPGQVGREDGRYRDSAGYRDGDRYGSDYNDDRYVWQRDRDGRMVQIDRRTGRVVRVGSR